MKIAVNQSYPSRRNALRTEASTDSGITLAELQTDSRSKRGASYRGQAAFTLVEILVAASVLAVMSVALYGGISFCFANITLARQNLRATQIALEKMEIVRMYSWEQVNTVGFVPPTFTAPYYPNSGSDTNGGLTYYGTTDIRNLDLGTPYTTDMLKLSSRSIGQTKTCRSRCR